MAAYRPLDDFDHGILSPSGKISKRARKAALKRLTDRLWPNGLTREMLYGPGPAQPTEKERLLEQAKRLRDLADRGMARRKYTKEADRLEKLAAELDDERKEIK